MQQLLNPTVPLAAWREGDFSNLLPGTVIRNPFTGEPYQNNVIPAAQINPVARRLQERFYPLPNFGPGTTLPNQNYRELKARPFDPSTYLTTRGDHRFSDKVTTFARFTWQRLWNRTYEGNLPTIGQRWQQRNTRALAAALTYAIRSNLLYEVRYGLNFNNNPYNGPVMGKSLIQELGIQGLFEDIPDIKKILNVSFTRIGPRDRWSSGEAAEELGVTAGLCQKGTLSTRGVCQKG